MSRNYPLESTKSPKIIGFRPLAPMPRATGGRKESDDLDLGANNSARNSNRECAVSSTKLTEREEQILKGLAKGHSNKMIAGTCASMEATIKVHVKSILRKIGVSNRTQAAIWALENGYGAAVKDRVLTASAT